jgi:hypothetical protein
MINEIDRTLTRFGRAFANLRGGGLMGFKKAYKALLTWILLILLSVSTGCNGNIGSMSLGSLGDLLGGKGNGQGYGGDRPLEKHYRIVPGHTCVDASGVRHLSYKSAISVRDNGVIVLEGDVCSQTEQILSKQEIDGSPYFSRLIAHDSKLFDKRKTPPDMTSPDETFSKIWCKWPLRTTKAVSVAITSNLAGNDFTVEVTVGEKATVEETRFTTKRKVPLFKAAESDDGRFLEYRADDFYLKIDREDLRSTSRGGSRIKYGALLEAVFEGVSYTQTKPCYISE